jgi:HEAT repeat protein
VYELVLSVAVVGLLLWAAILIAATVIIKILGERRLRRRVALERRWRAPVEALILDDREFTPPSDRRSRAMVLDLLLRYLDRLRGREAEVIGAFLERKGLLDQALADLTSRRRWTRAAAADILGRARSRRAVPGLVRALRDPNEDVRTVAARGLAGIRDPSSIAALAEALAMPSRWTMSMVADDLMAMGPEAVPALLDMLVIGSHNVRVAVVQILGEIRDPRAIHRLVKLLRNSPEVNMRAQTAAALGKLGGQEAEAALEVALNDGAWQVRAQAAKALGRIGHTAMAPRLAAAIHDENWWVRVNCAEALLELGDAGWTTLQELTISPDRYVREQCVGVLQQYALPPVAAAPRSDASP